MSLFAGDGQVHQGGFRADQLKLTFGGQQTSGHLVQSAQFSFTQQVRMLYEIGSNSVYYVGGRAQGTTQLARIVGPSAFSNVFLQTYNDICSPAGLKLEASAGCDSGTVTYNMTDAVLTGLSGSVTAQDVVINEQMAFMFIDLDTEAAA